MRQPAKSLETHIFRRGKAINSGTLTPILRRDKRKRGFRTETVCDREIIHKAPQRPPLRRGRLMAERKSSFGYEDLLACARGELFGPGNAQLPYPPMLMFDRITEISETGGAFDKGFIRAEFDIKPDLWFFACHFIGNPIMPGCLGLDALWQMTGFYLGWLGEPGKGMALSTGEVKFKGMVTPAVQKVEYGVDFKRVMRGRLVLGIADGWLKADGEPIYAATDLKVGLSKQSAG